MSHTSFKRYRDEDDDSLGWTPGTIQATPGASPWTPGRSLFNYVIGEDLPDPSQTIDLTIPEDQVLPSQLTGAAEEFSEGTQASEVINPVVLDLFDDPPLNEGRGFRRWAFVLNNYTDAELAALKPWLQTKTEFHVVHFEVGDQGTPHLQGYFRLKDATTSARLHKKPGLARSALKICRGTEEHNVIYCEKTGNASCFSKGGTMQPGQGARTDIKLAAEKIRDGGMTAYKRMAHEEPVMIVKYAKGFMHLMEAVDKPRYLDKPPDVIYFYGESGAGKSMAAYALAEQIKKDRGVECVEIDTGMLPFCDGYAGEKIVMMNDFRTRNHHGVELAVDIFLKMLDRFPYRLNIKGSSRHLQADTFIFTNTQHPSAFFNGKGATEPQKQWLRRITRVVKCVKKNVDGVDVYEQEECGNGEQPEIIPFIA